MSQKKTKEQPDSASREDLNYDAFRLDVISGTQILKLYAMGNSLQDISRHLKKMYGAKMGTARLSEVINSTWERVKK